MIKQPGKKSKPRAVEVPVEVKAPPLAPNPACLWDRPGVAEQVDNYWRNSPNERAHRQRLAKLVAEYSQPGAKLLEVGCGTGLVYEALADTIPGLSYVGVDYSREMLDIAKRRYPDAMFRAGNAEALDYPDGFFDTVVAFEVFGHFADFSKMLAELVRVARRTAIFTIWLASGTKRLEGTDHYEHPYDSVREAIAAATGGKGVVILEGMHPVAAFVIEKVQG